MLPKPNKADRLAEKGAQQQALREYRRTNVTIAILRDDNLCVFCWFLSGKRTRRDDVHHVFSRGKTAGDWREHYTSLVCTCKAHHPMPIQVPGASQNLTWVEDVLRQANERPINSNFRHEDYR
jgi:hypothetical protein